MLSFGGRGAGDVPFYAHCMRSPLCLGHRAAFAMVYPGGPGPGGRFCFAKGIAAFADFAGANGAGKTITVLLNVHLNERFNNDLSDNGRTR